MEETTWKFRVTMTWDPDTREWRGVAIEDGADPLERAEAWSQTLRAVSNHLTTHIESTVLNSAPKVPSR